MLIRRKPLEAIVEETQVEMHTLGFRFQGEAAEVLSDFVNQHEKDTEQDRELKNCTCFFAGPRCVIYCGLSLSVRQGKELLTAVQWAHAKLQGRKEEKPAGLRVSNCQLNIPSDQWELIEKHHYHLLNQSLKVKDGLGIAHVNIPASSVFQVDRSLGYTLPERKSIHQLARLLSYEGWLQYSSWLNQDMEELFAAFLPDAVDEYQVESCIKDFSHELSSYLLISYKNRAQEISLRIGARAFAEDSEIQLVKQEEILEWEKELVALRNEIRLNLQYQQRILEQCSFNIEKIVKTHPELGRVKNASRLLALLLAEQIDLTGSESLRWDRRMFLYALLNVSLDVLPVFTCDEAENRASFCAMIELAVYELLKAHDFDALVALAMEWDEAVGSFNRLLAKRPSAEGDFVLEPQWLLIEKLRRSIYENLRHFSSSFFHDPANAHSEKVLDPQYLNFFPGHLDLPRGGKTKMCSIVIYDPSSGNPLSLTEIGKDAVLGIV